MSARAQPAKPRTSEALGSSSTARLACSRASFSAASRSSTSDSRPPNALKQREQRARECEVGIDRDGLAQFDRRLRRPHLRSSHERRSSRRRRRKCDHASTFSLRRLPDDREVRLGQRGFQFDDDLARDLVLKFERVAAFHIVAAGPELVAARRFDELNGDAHAVARAARAAGDDVAHAQFGADLPDFGRTLRVGKTRTPGRSRRSPGTRASNAMMSSARPLAISSSARSSERFSNGSTAIDGRSAIRGGVSTSVAAKRRHVCPVRGCRRRSAGPCAARCGSSPAGCRCRRSPCAPR